MALSPAHPASTLPYADGDAPPPRISRLAVASIPAGILSNPCILSAALGPVVNHLPQSLIDRGVYAWLVSWGVLTLMAATTAMPIAALIRVHRSRGRRTGMGLAVTGLTLSLLSWLLVLLISLTWRGWGVAAG
jgi:hypothetical protein